MNTNSVEENKFSTTTCFKAEFALLQNNSFYALKKCSFYSGGYKSNFSFLLLGHSDTIKRINNTPHGAIAPNKKSK